jgi:hypothetical protein
MATLVTYNPEVFSNLATAYDRVRKHSDCANAIEQIGVYIQNGYTIESVRDIIVETMQLTNNFVVLKALAEAYRAI